MEKKKEAGWNLHPAGGVTGKAYMGTRNQEKVFLKRNTSPFLATLALEGIAPKLIWTKRIENGDVLTAQVWCNGRTLEASEMKEPRVFYLLKKVHQSKTLGRLLEKVGGKYLLPADLLDTYVERLAGVLKMNDTLEKAYEYLVNHLDDVEPAPEYCASHGDIHHDNYLLSDQDELFLVDWDSAILADPAYDIGQLIARYISAADWDEWIEHIEFKQSPEFVARIHWYMMATLLLEIKKSLQEMNDEELFYKYEYLLKEWLKQF
ncbi:phosphotransferase family protein [Allofustis seminis]|uniref:phosphotransferase family protein n=1 Tax=Allofustis seminis TaxID=166939 RepID=UPI00037B5744|nr:phosphotransferase family protein [Allofustis seminis]